jgi:hypothetical protein
MKIFNKGVETLRMQVACFGMNSILIKPVQRILKYSLILSKLLKVLSLLIFYFQTVHCSIMIFILN